MDMFELARLIHGASRPYYITVGDDDRVLFRYPPGTVERWKKMLDEMIEKDLREHPEKIRNGKDD